MKNESLKEFLQCIKANCNVQLFLRNLQWTEAYESDPEFKEFVRDLIAVYDELQII